MKMNTVPEGYTSVTPWIVSANTAAQIKFLEGAFNAVEIPGSRITNDEGIIIHAVVKIGTAMVMLFDSRKGWGPTPALLNLYVEDVESTFEQAIALGATPVTKITQLWFGEKVCRVLDPLGNLWWICERVEEMDFSKAATPEAIEGIGYIQRSLNEALLKQKEFFG
ncbi:VOC family protein [Chitinophaga silvisoli]|uniref:VOC family protein n=1 Tax=Chitinophaga silvisoli TaxID=2291814 RepID=A0A3E1P056_9BACT|nr:VOC family protein [Chitinophaga silvisoli]RFM33563.1 VOC family protein [Chitinophaga silvisoli]